MSFLVDWVEGEPVFPPVGNDLPSLLKAVGRLDSELGSHEGRGEGHEPREAVELEEHERPVGLGCDFPNPANL
jgi:hypothetical protein